MSKRYINYSLWPEQARPRRALPLTLAAGGFAIGIVSAVAAYNVLTDFTRPIAMQEPGRPIAAEHVPVYATASAPASEPAEPASRNRSRTSVAKMTLPSIGTQAAVPVTPSATTDGRGGADVRGGGGLAGGNSVAVLPTVSATQPTALLEEPKPADEPAAAASSAPKAKPQAKSHTRKVAKRRERQPYYANYGGSFFGYRSSGASRSSRNSPAPFGGFRQLFAGQQY